MSVIPEKKRVASEKRGRLVLNTADQNAELR
jgi:hypothetical protein